MMMCAMCKQMIKGPPHDCPGATDLPTAKAAIVEFTIELHDLRAQLASAQAERDEARAEAGRRYPIETIRQMHEDGLAAVRATAAERDALRRERDRLADMHERIVEERDAALKRAEEAEGRFATESAERIRVRDLGLAAESRAADLARRLGEGVEKMEAVLERVDRYDVDDDAFGAARSWLDSERAKG